MRYDQNGVANGSPSRSISSKEPVLLAGATMRRWVHPTRQ